MGCKQETQAIKRERTHASSFSIHIVFTTEDVFNVRTYCWHCQQRARYPSPNDFSEQISRQYEILYLNGNLLNRGAISAKNGCRSPISKQSWATCLKKLFLLTYLFEYNLRLRVHDRKYLLSEVCFLGNKTLM